jgi:thioesterase domain-containing protein
VDRARKQNHAPLLDPLQQVLAVMWKQTLGASDFGAADDFFELGGDSIQGAIFINQLREKLGQEVPVATIFTNPTLERLADFLRQQYPTETARLMDGGDSQAQAQRLDQATDAAIDRWSPLVEIQQGKEPPLFLIHPVGGNVFCYVNLSRQLGPDHTIYGLQARGLDPKQAPHTRIEEMAACYIKSLRVAQPVGPYRLGGWSMGGLIAFEMARQLVLEGDEISSLILLDSHVLSSIAPADNEDNSLPLLARFAADLGLTTDNLSRSPDELLRLSFDEQLNQLLELAKSGGMVPDGGDFSYLRRLFYVFQANFNAAMSYQPSDYSGKITLLLAQDRPAKTGDPEAIWDTLALGGVDTYRVPGNHYSMFRPPHLQKLAAQLRACLSQATALTTGAA